VMGGAVILGSTVAAACSLAFPANGVQCTTTADCLVRGAAFAGSVCVESVCIAVDAGKPADAHADVTLEAHQDATDAHRDVTKVVDSASDGPPPADWSCVGHLKIPDAAHVPETLTVPFVDLASSLPVPGVRVLPCLGIDPLCMSPVADAAITNEAGQVTFTVPWGYQGDLLSTLDGDIPTIAYLSAAVYSRSTIHPYFMVETNLFFEIVAALQTLDGGTIKINPADGIIFLGIFDCAGVPAAGVNFTLSPSSPASTIAYLIQGLPILAATETDPFGGAAAVNIPVGSVTATAKVTATGQVVGINTGYVQQGRVSYLDIQPTPVN